MTAEFENEAGKKPYSPPWASDSILRSYIDAQQLKNLLDGIQSARKQTVEMDTRSYCTFPTASIDTVDSLKIIINESKQFQELTSTQKSHAQYLERKLHESGAQTRTLQKTLDEYSQRDLELGIIRKETENSNEAL